MLFLLICSIFVGLCLPRKKFLSCFLGKFDLGGSKSRCVCSTYSVSWMYGKLIWSHVRGCFLIFGNNPHFKRWPCETGTPFSCRVRAVWNFCFSGCEVEGSPCTGRHRCHAVSQTFDYIILISGFAYVQVQCAFVHFPYSLLYEK